MPPKKPNRLAAAFNKTTATEPQAEEVIKTEGTKTGSREGKKTTIAYIDPAGARELKMLSVDTGRSQQDLLVEAINDLLIKHGKKALA